MISTYVGGNLEKPAITLKAHLQPHMNRTEQGVEMLTDLRDSFGNVVDSLNNEINILFIRIAGGEELSLDGSRNSDVDAISAYTSGIYNLEAQIAEYKITGGTEGIKVPSTFLLNPAYPNPFNSQTRISYTIPRAGIVNATIFDMAVGN